ncbi:MAG TPA: FMN-binding protein [Planctomycetota bacterium]|nr:FMN-binding protein [Planctomycetota bacterium]HRR81102.1 FMN-binding protein [Planctomycetota bacterium]HRT93478.1 FMN-binding protein [Planctomycetota bacterium]
MRSALALSLLAAAGSALAATPARKPSLDQALADLKIPPPWLDAVPLDVAPGTPWNKAWDRIEVLLMTADPADRRKAVKLAYEYQKDGRARDGMPAATYFLAGETAWALVEHRKLANKNAVAWMRLASCYRHFGEHAQALAALDEALKHLPDPPWRSFQEAQVSEARGDVLADRGDRAAAEAAYERARDLYAAIPPKPPLELAASRAAARVAAKADMLGRDALKTARLRDGTFSATVFGYSDHIRATVTVRDGRIADVTLDHKERADLGARTVLPERIVREQRADVDAITGATITSQAIQSAVFQALKQSAGL